MEKESSEMTSRTVVWITGKVGVVVPKERIEKPKLINEWKDGWFSLGYVKCVVFCSCT